VAAQLGDPASTLSLYSTGLRLRRELAALGAGELRWLSQPGDDLLAFERPARDGGPAVICAVNLGTTPAHIRWGTPILASSPLTADSLLPPDTAAWWS